MFVYYACCPLCISVMSGSKHCVVGIKCGGRSNASHLARFLGRTASIQSVSYLESLTFPIATLVCCDLIDLFDLSLY